MFFELTKASVSWDSHGVVWKCSAFSIHTDSGARGAVGITGRSLSWAAAQGMAVLQQGCCPWSSAPTGAAGFEVCHCPAFKSHHGWGALFLHAGCCVTPRIADGFAHMLLCWRDGLCSHRRAFCLRKGRERLVLEPFMCLWPGLTWAL